MAVPATYSEIVDYLSRVPAASPSWAEGLFSAKLSMASVDQFISTMRVDPDSPLRRAEEGLMGREIVRVNQERGATSARGTVPGKMPVRLRVVLTAAEQTRVVRIVGGFCQPYFDSYNKFGSSGHAVMNAVRRATAAYLTAKVPVGASVIEVGPDLKNWMLSPTPSQWAGERIGAYVGARPVLGPRDSIRVEWNRLAESIESAREGFYSSDSKEKVQLMLRSFSKIFPNRRIQDLNRNGEYILSFDSNYDIKFSDMPVVMGACRSRAWYGTMVRVKGLTSGTRLREGSLELMGVNFRVGWEKGRIDFRHPECTAFGYSHGVWEYMRYEEHNGYVWTTQDCHYVYSKGPETTDEILFFSVVRVPKVHGLYEPRFVEDPHAGQVELTSIWAVGDEVNGVPSSFGSVVFHVDALNFSKVLEKRRALDHKGDLATSVALVRSTNVRFWLHGTPVGVNNRIEARLAEATAVVVESLVAERRLCSNYLFEHAMFVHDFNLAKAGWMRRLLESVIDLRAVAGTVVAPIMAIWQDVRQTIIDKALSPLSQVKVGMRLVGEHVKLDGGTSVYFDATWSGVSGSACGCIEHSDLRAALAMADGRDRTAIARYIEGKSKISTCVECTMSPQLLLESGSDVETVDSSSTEEGSTSTEATQVTQVDTSDSWIDDEKAGMVEAQAMAEFVKIEEYLARAQLSELRIDSSRIFMKGPVGDALLKEESTTRTKHAVFEFLGGRCVRTWGCDVGVVSALYDHKRDLIVNVRSKGDVMYAQVSDGYYYTCNRLKVWNGPALVSAVNYALAHGVVRPHRRIVHQVLGVPGAGKTYRMMEEVAKRWKGGDSDFIVTSATKASSQAALRYGIKFGVPIEVLSPRVVTVDSYLINRKTPAASLYCDETPMMHMGKIDAVVSLTGARRVRLFGDARQIPYDPFCAELEVKYATLGGTVSDKQVEFMPMTHRLPADVCAMWLDQYPMIYPCDCCATEAKTRSTCSVTRVRDLSDLRYDGVVRFHTYKQDERDNLRSLLSMPGDNESLRLVERGGLATVHEDQGSTHPKVITVRLEADYDKNASSRNPSLYNRERYVLTDTTRHTESYCYYTFCEEEDVICKRVKLSRDPVRLDLVRRKEGLGVVKIGDLL